MEGEPRFVGIDVSKAQLDVAVRPTGKRWVLPNDETGIEGLIPQGYRIWISGGHFRGQPLLSIADFGG